MKTIACIAVRMKSERLPRKALVEISAKPLLLHLVERLRTSEKLDDTVICTSTHPDDKILLSLADEWGVKSLAGSELDVLSRLIGAAEREGADNVVRVTGDNPLTDPGYTDKIIERQYRNGNDYTKVIGMPLGTNPQVISLKLLKHLHGTMDDPNKSEYLTFYLDDILDDPNFKCEALEAEENLRRDYRLTVDNPEDLELMKAIFGELYDPDKVFKLADAISFLDSKPELAISNQDVEQLGREAIK